MREKPLEERRRQTRTKKTVTLPVSVRLCFVVHNPQINRQKTENTLRKKVEKENEDT
jgi:hypothetical protein